MTTIQLEALKDYIKAVAEKAVDNGQASDEGLLSSIALSEAEKELDAAFISEE